MLIPIRQTVTLSGGNVTLRAWGARVADAYLSDLLTLSVTLGAMREQWHELRPGDLEPVIWEAFWRLTQASLEPGCVLPGPLTWHDCLTVLEALFDLNDVEEAEKKAQALSGRVTRLLERARQARGNLSA